MPPIPRDREILIFEPSAGGHEMFFVRLVAHALQACGGGPVSFVTTAKSIGHELTQPLLEPGLFCSVETIQPGAIEVRFPYGLYPGAARQYQETMALARLVADRGGADQIRMIFVSYLDSSSIIPLAFERYPFGDVPFAGLLIRPTYHLRAAGVPVPRRLKSLPEREIYRRILAHPKLAVLFSIDPYFVRYAADSRVQYVPDPAAFVGTPVPGAWRAKFGIAPHAIVILIYGHIDARKGFAQLIRGVAHLRQSVPVVLLAAGRQHAELIGSLPQPETDALRQAGAMIELDRFITSDEEHEIFLAADIVWVCYGNHYVGTSGVMVKAGQAGRPVIASPGGIIGQMVRDHRIGATANTEDVADVATVLRRLACDPELRRDFGAAGQRIFSQHMPAAFARPIAERLKSTLPSGPQPGPKISANPVPTS